MGLCQRQRGRGGIISQYEREALKELDIELAPGAREQAFIQRFLFVSKHDKAIQGALYQLYEA